MRFLGAPTLKYQQHLEEARLPLASRLKSAGYGFQSTSGTSFVTIVYGVESTVLVTVGRVYEGIGSNWPLSPLITIIPSFVKPGERSLTGDNLSARARLSCFLRMRPVVYVTLLE